MEATLAQYRALFGARTFVRSVGQGAAFLAASVIAIFAAVTYATTNASNHVTDIVLSNVGPFDMRFLFVYGTFIGFVLVGSLLAWKPNCLPFALKSMALFLLVRAVFVSLTHIAPSPIEPPTPAPFLNSIFYGSDQFFSGHTGLPFLLALAFWHMPLLRSLFSGRDGVLRHHRAARALSLFDRRARGVVHHPWHLPTGLLAVSQDYALFRSSELQSARRSRKAAGEDATQDATNEFPSGPKKRVRRRIRKWVAQARKPRAPLPAAAASLPAPSERVVLHLVEKD